MRTTVSYDYLVQHRACERQALLFKELCGEGEVELTGDFARQHYWRFDWYWARRIVNAPLRVPMQQARNREWQRGHYFDEQVLPADYHDLVDLSEHLWLLDQALTVVRLVQRYGVVE